MVSGVAVWQEDDGHEVLEQAVKIAEDAVPTGRKVSIASEVMFSAPVPTLVDLSEEAEMIVVGCNGRGAVGRVLLGSGQFGRDAQRKVSGRGHSCRSFAHAALRSGSSAGGDRLLARVGACAGHCIR